MKLQDANQEIRSLAISLWSEEKFNHDNGFADPFWKVLEEWEFDPVTMEFTHPDGRKVKVDL